MSENEFDEMLSDDIFSFLDGLDAEDTSFVQEDARCQPIANSESRLSALYEAAASCTDATRAPKNTRRRKYRRGYATELLERKKAEVQHLRTQKQEMEEWLERQRKRGRNFEVDTSEPLQNEHQGQWAAKALEEFQKRRQSERVNRKLKEIETNQIELVKSLQQVLEQDFEVEGETLQDVMEMGMTYAADADTQPGLIQVQGP